MVDGQENERREGRVTLQVLMSVPVGEGVMETQTFRF